MADEADARTEAATPSEATTHDGTDSSTSAEEFYEPPCRVAGRFLVRCPVCSKKVQVRTLRYSHVCGRTFNPQERALEQKKAAEAAVHARVARTQQQEYRPVEQKIAAQAPDRSVGHLADNRKRGQKEFAIC